MADSPIELHLIDSRATEELGAALARSFQGTGQDSAVVYLRGELGAGKTTSVRSLLRTLGVEGLIRSPTYTLVEAYQSPSITCVHVDLYRLQEGTEVDELGLQDYLDESLLLVEWPEKGAGRLPPADIELTLSYLENSRQAHLGAFTQRGRRWLSLLLQDASLIPYVSNLT